MANKKLENYFYNLLGRQPDHVTHCYCRYFFFEEMLQYNSAKDKWFQMSMINNKLHWKAEEYCDNWIPYSHDISENKEGTDVDSAYIQFIAYKLEEAFFD